MIALCLLAWLFSENKKQVRIPQVCAGLLIQLILAAFLLKLPWSKDVFLVLNKGVLLLQEATKAGTSFTFGYLGGGTTVAEVLDDIPDMTADDIQACFAFAADPDRRLTVVPYQTALR